MTSPPYFANRRYGDHEDEIGAGSEEQYFEDMRACAREWLRVAAPHCTLWLNIFDTAAGSGGAGGDYSPDGRMAGRSKYRQGKVGRKRMQWLNIPHRVVEVFEEEGWYYRHCIIWDKGSCRPEDVRHVRRPLVSHEYIFMLTASTKYQFNDTGFKEKGSVWHFPPSRRGSGHAAPFPLELPDRCLSLSAVPGDLVLDPFVGSGTTMEAAALHGCRGLGIDLYADGSGDRAAVA